MNLEVVKVRVCFNVSNIFFREVLIEQIGRCKISFGHTNNFQIIELVDLQTKSMKSDIVFLFTAKKIN